MGVNIANGLDSSITPSITLSEKENRRQESKVFSSLSSVYCPDSSCFPREIKRNINEIAEKNGELHLLSESLIRENLGKNKIKLAQENSKSPLYFTDGARELFNNLTLSGINLKGLNIERESKEKKTELFLLGILTNFSKDKINYRAADELSKITESDNYTDAKTTVIGRELKNLLFISGHEAFHHFIECFNHECDKKWSEIHPGLVLNDPKSEQYNINQQFCNKHAISLIKSLTAKNATELEIQTRFRLLRDVFLAQASTLDSGYPVDRYLTEEAAALTSEITPNGAGEHLYQTERSDNAARSSCQIQTVAEIHAPPVNDRVKRLSHHEIDRVNKPNAEPSALYDNESDECQAINN